MADLTAYWVAESTVIAAHSAEEAENLLEDICGRGWAQDCGEHPPRPLSDADLDERYQDFDEDENPIPGKTTSLRELLAAMSEPGLLTDWE